MKEWREGKALRAEEQHKQRLRGLHSLACTVVVVVGEGLVGVGRGVAGRSAFWAGVWDEAY